METNKIFMDVAQRAREFAEMCERMANETKQKADPEAWREDCLAKQAAGVKFEKIGQGGLVWLPYVGGFENGIKEDYREVPQEVQKEGDIRIPEASREVLKQWQENGLKFKEREFLVNFPLKFDCIAKGNYNIHEQPIPEGMSVEMVEAMWRQGLMLEFDGNFGWDLAADGFDWNGIYRGAQLLARLRIPAQPIPEKLTEVPQQEPHAAERALWKAQRDAGTNEVWQFMGIGNVWLDCAECKEPEWLVACQYHVKPMKLTAKIIRRGVYKTSYYWEFFGTREEYRAECEKYGYAVISEIKEVVEKPKTVTYYFAMLNRYRCTPFGRAASDKDQIIEYAKKHCYTIIGDIEEREVEA